MNIIKQLPRHVADLIAAGEVAERPAAVVKELVENSLDADASFVAVEIKGGGNLYARVTDDGTGMSPEDAKNAFKRHATSKIAAAEDLLNVRTMGFRGEALAAISAVSRVTLNTRLRGEDFGTALELEGGEVIDEHEAGMPTGTSVIVRDLFFNTPARQKFLKKDSSEAAQVQTAVLRAAFARPDVSVAYISDGREIFRTPGNGELLSCVRAIWGGDAAGEMKKIGGARERVRLLGLTGGAEATRGNRTWQHFFVNRRPVRSVTLTAAFEEAFKYAIPAGRYPVFIVNLMLPEGSYDINVHPAKLEVKFENEREIRELVYSAARDLITGEIQQPKLSVKPEYSLQLTVDSGQWTVKERAVPEIVSEKPLEIVNKPPIIQSPPPVTKTVHCQLSTVHCTLVGEVLGGFLAAECEGKLYFVDKHAAHERYLFNKLMSRENAVMSQTLIAPVYVTVSAEDADALADNAELITRSGLEAEPFGPNCMVVRAVPEGFGFEREEIAGLLTALAASVGRKSGPVEDRLGKIFETVACKAAVKVGKVFSREEALKVLEWVFNATEESGAVRRCPHGRPVAFEFTEAEMRKRFLR